MTELFKSAKELSLGQSQRYLVPILCFFALLVMYLVRYPLTISMRHINERYHYTQTQEGLIKGGFFIGYLPSQILGGYLGRRYGGKYVNMFGLLLSCLSCALIPVSAGVFSLFVILRIIIGVGQGVMYPSMIDLLSQWILPSERTFFLNFAWSGAQIGTILEFSIYPRLLESFSWEFGFYLIAAAGAGWAIAWVLLIYNHPKEHPWISKKELEVLLKYEAMTRDKKLLDRSQRIPYLQLLTSSPVYALIIVSFCYNWVFYLFMEGIEKYCTSVLGSVPIPGFLTLSVPYFVLWGSILLSGYLSDVLIRSGLKLSLVRRSLVLLGFIPCAILLFCMPAYSTSTSTYISLVFAVGLAGISQCGYSPNSMELSPEFASTIASIVNMIASSSGLIVPVITGAIMESNNCKDKRATECVRAWHILLAVAASVYIFGAIVWTFFSRFRKLKLVINDSQC